MVFCSKAARIDTAKRDMKLTSVVGCVVTTMIVTCYKTCYFTCFLGKNDL